VTEIAKPSHKRRYTVTLEVDVFEPEGHFVHDWRVDAEDGPIAINGCGRDLEGLGGLVASLIADDLPRRPDPLVPSSAPIVIAKIWEDGDYHLVPFHEDRALEHGVHTALCGRTFRTIETKTPGAPVCEECQERARQTIALADALVDTWMRLESNRNVLGGLRPSDDPLPPPSRGQVDRVASAVFRRGYSYVVTVDNDTGHYSIGVDHDESNTSFDPDFWHGEAEGTVCSDAIDQAQQAADIFVQEQKDP
jgi:hypothetical protein